MEARFKAKTASEVVTKMAGDISCPKTVLAGFTLRNCGAC
jgi:hypothetical protein